MPIFFQRHLVLGCFLAAEDDDEDDAPGAEPPPAASSSAAVAMTANSEVSSTAVAELRWFGTGGAWRVLRRTVGGMW